MDPLANFLTKIRNAYLVRKEEISVPASKLIADVAAVLVKEGYLAQVERKEENDQHPVLVMKLKYHQEAPSVLRIRQISKPGRRVYASTDRLPRPIGGFGTIVLSTPKGVVTALQAKRSRVGGEVLCEVIRGAQG